MTKHCCEMMDDNTTNVCDIHKSSFDCPDCLIHFKDGEYGIIIHDGGNSFIRIAFCPWCGEKLPNVNELNEVNRFLEEHEVEHKRKEPPPPPRPPSCSLITEGTVGSCPECGSTENRFLIFFQKTGGCIQPECKFYENRNMFGMLRRSHNRGNII